MKINTKWDQFILIWMGQAVSTIGSGMTGFALGVWLFQETGRATPFTLVALANILPRVLFSSYTGHLADRFSRRALIIFADTGAAITTLLLALFWWQGSLNLFLIVLFTFFNAVFNSIQIPAYHASISNWVTPNKLKQANGLIQFGQAAADILTPLAAGFLLNIIGLTGIFIIDGTTFFFAVLMLYLFTSKDTKNNTSQEKKDKMAFAQNWKILRQYPGMPYLFLFMMSLMVFWGLFTVLVTPLIVDFAGAEGLGTVFSIAGIGLMLGSMLFMRIPKSTNLIQLLLCMETISALAFFLMGFQPSLGLVLVGAVIAHLSLAVIHSGNRVIWQTTISNPEQGSAFGLLETGTNAGRLLGVLIAGPLVDLVFSPLYAKTYWMQNIVGGGTNLNRGIAVFILLIAFGKLLLSLSGFLNRRISSIAVKLG